jgi:hypothetical protein
MKDKETLLDEFAGIALAALIGKLPFLDVLGELGTPVTDQQMAEIKAGVPAAAYEYASHMLIARTKSLRWLEENESNLR